MPPLFRQSAVALQNIVTLVSSCSKVVLITRNVILFQFGFRFFALQVYFPMFLFCSVAIHLLVNAKPAILAYKPVVPVFSCLLSVILGFLRESGVLQLFLK